MLNEETRNYILKHADEDVRKLALKMPADDRIDVRMALQQIEGRQIARKKLPAWSVHQDILFPPRLSLEQCSSEITALYKQALVKRLLNGINKDKGEMLVDLTGDDMGILIGKRGQTLDALQYLVNLVVNKNSASYISVMLDTENYRQRRKDTLENLAV